MKFKIIDMKKFNKKIVNFLTKKIIKFLIIFKLFVKVHKK